MGRFLDQPQTNKSKGRFLDETPVNSSPNAEYLIASRPSALEKPINPINLTPLGGSKMIPESIRALSGGMEVAEGIPADIGLGLQKARETGGKSVLQIPSDIFKTMQGKRPAQFGDIYRDAGAPEPLAATGGFLASASKYTPTGAFGEKAVEGAGKVLGPVVKPVLEPIGKAVKKGAANVISHLSGVPQESVNLALDDPRVLSGKYMKNEVKEAGKEYGKKVTPLINDASAEVVATPRTKGLMQNLNLYTPSGESTKVLSTMSEPEQKLIGDWLKRADNGSGKIGFNDADKIIGEIDSELQGYYKAKKMGQVYKDSQFDRVAKEIRNAVSEARKSQFPEAGAAIDRYSGAMKGQTANEKFGRVLPHSSFRGSVARAALEAGLGFLHPEAALVSAAAQSPFLYGKAIQLGSAAGKNFMNPSLIAQSLRKMREPNK